MPEETSTETLLQQILEKRPEITRQQLQERLSATRDMTGGLIADDSLMRMIAAELGVEIANENGTYKHKLSIGHIVAGLNNATVTGRIVAVFPVRTFEGAKPGKLGSVTIVDNEGVLRVILWNEKSDLLQSGKIQTGQIVKFAHGYTKADRFGTAELHIGERGEIDLNPENAKDEDYPSINKFMTKISQIKMENRTVNIVGNVKDIYAASTFTRADQTAGKVLRLKVNDETGEVVAVFWNEKAEEVEPKIKRGVQIQIINARPKINQNDQDQIELHVDSSSFISISEVPKQLLKISALTSELGDVNLESEVASLPVCKEVKTSKGEMVKLTTLDLRDETGTIRLTAWREHAETACNLLIGEKILIENAYSKVGYNGKIELSTRTTTVLTRI